MSQRRGKSKHNKKRNKPLSPFIDPAFRRQYGRTAYEALCRVLQADGHHFSAKFLTLDGTALWANKSNCAAKSDNSLYKSLKYPLVQWLGDNNPSAFLVDTYENGRLKPVLYVKTCLGQVSFHVRVEEIEQKLINISKFQRGNIHWKKLYMQEHADELLTWYTRVQDKSRDVQQTWNDFHKWKKTLMRLAKRRERSAGGWKS